MNELLGAIIVASSLEDINNSIKSKGFNDYDDLIAAIRHLDIEIAKAKDENKPFEEKLKLRNEYINLKRQYEIAFEEKKKKDRRNGWIFLAVFGAVVIVGLTILLVWLSNL